MKKILAVMALAFTCAATQAIAAPVTIEYKLNISSIYQDGAYLQTTDLQGFDISVGETVTGYFHYDTTQPLIADGSDGYALFENFSLGFKFDNSPQLVTLDHYPNLHAYQGEQLAIWGYAYGAPETSWAWTRAYFHFTDDPYTPLNGYLPAPDRWAGFLPISNIRYIHQNGQGEFSAEGNITSFRVVSSVPEPEAYLLWTGGILLLLAGRIRQRQPR